MRQLSSSASITRISPTTTITTAHFHISSIAIAKDIGLTQTTTSLPHRDQSAMAEIFGAVASGAGLVSLSMQLLESAQKLKGFCDPARDAPTTVTRLSSEMETMSLLLRQFESFRRNQIFGDQVLDSCIKSCEEAVSKIKDSVGRVERLLLVPKTRSLGKTYMGFKEPKIRKLLEEMEHAKSSVLLAFSSYHQCAYLSMFESHC
jgi:hypothetical protein